jgi:hypothetical protein
MTDTTEGFEERFDRTVGSYTNEYSYVHKIPNSEAIKAFFTQELAIAREEAEKRGEINAYRNAHQILDDIAYEVETPGSVELHLNWDEGQKLLKHAHPNPLTVLSNSYEEILAAFERAISLPQSYGDTAPLRLILNLLLEIRDSLKEKTT